VNIKVVYEDNHIIVIDKQPGILSQGDISGKDSLLEIIKEYIREKYHKPGNVFLGLVHRLDRPVSGVMVFAKTSKAAKRLSEQFAQKTVSKYYLALVEEKRLKKNPVIEGGWNTVENHLVRKGDRTFIADRKTGDSKTGKLNFFIIEKFGKIKLLLVKLETGRKHQIRAQLSNLMGPIPGDKKYGSTIDMGQGIALHSCHLAFSHPTLKTEMEFHSDIPGRFFKQIDGADKKALSERVHAIINDREHSIRKD